MSSPSREAEKKRKLEAECERRDAETSRKNSLDMWSRIEELKSWEDVKDILHRMDDRLDMIHAKVFDE